MDAAIWLRVSDDSQHEENQLPALERFCAHHGLNITARYILHDQSAYRGEHKAVLEQAKDAAYRGEFSVLVVWALDRICRGGVEELLRLVRELSQRNCTLMSVQEPWCSGTAAVTELLLSVTAWKDRQESARKSERVRAGMDRARAEGRKVGGRQKGARDRRPRDPEPYRRAWAARHQPVPS